MFNGIYSEMWNVIVYKNIFFFAYLNALLTPLNKYQQFKKELIMKISLLL